MIYLKHPLHGSKIAIAETEAEYDEKNGWVRYNPLTPSDPATEFAPVEDAAPVVKQEVKRRRKAVE